jgi:hypothetical protein
MKELAWAFVLLPFIMIGSSIIWGGGYYYSEGMSVKKSTPKPTKAPQKAKKQTKTLMPATNKLIPALNDATIVTTPIIPPGQSAVNMSSL